MSWGSIISTALDVVSAGWGIYSSYQAGAAAEEQGEAQAAEVLATAEENAAISRYDASVALADAVASEIQAGYRLKVHNKTVDRLLGAQSARFAKGGVAVSEGSPLDVRLSDISKAAQDAEVIIYNGLSAAERRRSAAARYEMLAAAGLRDAAAHATLIEDSADYTATSYYMQAGVKGLSSLADMATEYNWW